MTLTGISRIDDLLAGRSTDPVGAGGDAETVGFIQDLLIGHDFRGLPGVLGAGRGIFGPHSTDAVRQFQEARNLPATGTVDGRKSITWLHAFAPRIQSERGIAFMLDLANQHGDAGAESIFRKVDAHGLSDDDLLTALQRESVARVHAQSGDGAVVQSTLARREAFRKSSALSDQAFVV